MLIRLLRIYLRPYRNLLYAVLAFQFVQTMATLLLPTLNADIIDKGVLTGDTGYIWRLGGLMLGVAAVQVVFAIAATYFGSEAAMASVGTSAGACSTASRATPPGGRPLRGALAHHPDHQ